MAHVDTTSPARARGVGFSSRAAALLGGLSLRFRQRAARKRRDEILARLTERELEDIGLTQAPRRAMPGLPAFPRV